MRVFTVEEAKTFLKVALPTMYGTTNVGQRPHVARQIDGQIRVVKGYNIDVQVGMQFREFTSTIVLSTTVRGSAARISRKESFSSSTTSARPDSDSETLFVKVNFAEPVSREFPMTGRLGTDSAFEMADSAGAYYISLITGAGAGKKAVGLFFSLSGFRRKVERYELVVRKYSPNGGSLAGVAGASLALAPDEA